MSAKVYRFMSSPLYRVVRISYGIRPVAEPRHNICYRHRKLSIAKMDGLSVRLLRDQFSGLKLLDF